MADDHLNRIPKVPVEQMKKAAGAKEANKEKRKRSGEGYGTYWDKKTDALESDDAAKTNPIKQTNALITRSAPEARGSCAQSTAVEVKDSVEPVIRGILPEIGRRFIKLLEFVGAGAIATGFSYPFEAVLLKRSEFRLVEPCLIEGACAGGCPMFAVTIGALDGVEPWLCFRGGGVGR